MKRAVQAAHAAYRLERSEAEWLEGLLALMAPLLDRGRGVVAYRWVCDRHRVQALTFRQQGGRGGDEQMFRDLLQHLDPTRARLAYEHPYRYRALSEIAGEHPTLKHLRQDSDMQRLAHGRDVVDFEMLRMDEGGGSGFMFCVLLDRPVAMSASRRAIWERVGAHVAAGARLRRRLDSRGLEGAAAVFDRSRSLLEVPDPRLRSEHARQQVRHLIEAREHASSLAADRPLEALNLWQGMVEGRWSLLDVIDTDGRSFTVLHENPLEVRCNVSLSERERQVAYLVGRGHHVKLAAYELGLSPSTVRSQLRSALLKLNLEDRSALVRLVASVFGAESQIRLAESELLVLAQPPLRLPAGLSEAERDVARQVAQGRTNAEIAAARGSAERTVANQLASIYRKLGLNSRQELVQTICDEQPSTDPG
ncbi:hypothetical protein DL240_09000 [Lujinxingia litoralis]|uniref:HTH luxR-type domain-containing protein n=1 Tax=Lujinxingia litoralis TaxID=2211119 RepID=A0A328CA25_9DELT|nr:helix-turn-helix transcriptional regulator [Lujinxingia litoralis]RAL23015.1 hypothetical protein DL240_09000 [Lujinxingia litoralis]